MNRISDDLFIKVEPGIGNKTAIIKILRESIRKTSENWLKDIQEYIYNREVSRINTSVNKNIYTR